MWHDVSDVVDVPREPDHDRTGWLARRCDREREVGEEGEEGEEGCAVSRSRDDTGTRLSRAAHN